MAEAEEARNATASRPTLDAMDGGADRRAGESPQRHLVELVDQISALAADAVAVDLASDDARRRTHQLSEHLARHVRPRARSLEAPLLILLVGPTGAGKSSLFNSLAGRRTSPTGVLRPTTRDLVAFVRPGDQAVLTGPDGPLAGIEPERVTIVTSDAAPDGVVLVDAPDVDSVEHANRALTDRLVEAADLAVFVTTASRYADRVPWEVLGRVKDRGLPLVVVANRMPADPEDRTIVVDDLRRLLADADLVGRTEIELLGVPEGALDPSIDGLDRVALEPLIGRIRELAADRDARLALAARALAGSLAGLEPQVRTIADDFDHAAIDADRLRRIATDAFERELGGLRDELARGSFLRSEALRHWQEFIGADEITRAFSTGIGRVRAAVSSLVRRTPQAPIAEVREQTIADLGALAAVRLGEAARRTAAGWEAEPSARAVLREHPEAWTPSPDLDARLQAGLSGWADAIAEDVRATGAPKRTLARGASLGVNATGIGVMLATFSHTGGLTGAEVGIAAATGFINQKLLTALFGEAALVEMIGRARTGLMDLLADTFREELGRFDHLVPAPDRLRAIAGDLRAAADELRRLPPSIPVSATPVMLPDAPRLGFPIEPGLRAAR